MTGWRVGVLRTIAAITIGSSLFLIAVGAILKFAVADAIDGVNLATIGVILMIVGAAGLLLGLLLLSRARRPVATERIYDRRV